MKLMLDDSASEGEVIKSKQNVDEINLEVMDRLNMFGGSPLKA